jgi:uncharacterized membrane protein
LLHVIGATSDVDLGRFVSDSERRRMARELGRALQAG